MSISRLLPLIMVILALAAPATAQDPDTTRDPRALAERLLGYDGALTIPEPTPLYEPGDRAEFWVGKTTSDMPTRITATLTGASGGVYLWAEDGIFFEEAAMNSLAGQIDRIFLALRQKSIYGSPTIIPEVGPVGDPTSLLALPDVDNDAHLFVIYTRDLGDAQFVINYHDELPEDLAPGGYTNQHETIYLNTSALPNAPLDNGAYVTLLAQAFYEYLMQSHAPEQAEWLKEALGTFIAQQLELPALRPNAATAFMQAPNTSLITPARANAAAEGGQQIFIAYAAQRFDAPLLQNLFLMPGQGLAPFDAALEVINATDPVSGELVTGDDLFADFVAANITTYMVDRLFGDGRYVHLFAELPQDVPPAATIIENQINTSFPSQSVNPYAAQYYLVGGQRAASFTLSFEGQATNQRLPLPADSAPENRFYWSGQAADRTVWLTRALDLTGVEAATLTFDIWYNLPDQRDYAYVEVSADGGETWDIVGGDLSSTRNRYGIAYGPGYTGLSTYEQPRPFPFLGVLLGGEGLTITEVTPGQPASRSDLQAGDVIIGVDGEAWQGPVDFINLLANNYNPGDTIDLYVQRGQEQVSVPIVLGDHPTRVRLPEPVWVSQEIDLSDYAGQEILLRFEVITQPQGGGSGVALDNIAIPEIDFSDDAENASEWTLHGWQQINNQVPQRFLVQYISSGTAQSSPRVRQLIGPRDEATSGEWQFNIQPGEIAAFAVSSLNADTTLPARFDLDFREER